MKILIFSTYFAPSVGGVETYVKLLADGLLSWKAGPGQEGIELTVATETPGEKWDDSPFGYKVCRRPGVRKLRQLIRDSDVVHLAGPSLLPMALAWIYRKPFTIEQHGYQAICPNGLLLRDPGRAPCPSHFLLGSYGRCLRCRAVDGGIAASLRSVLLTFPRRWLCKRAALNIAITDHVKERLKLKRSRTIYYGIEDVVTPTREKLSKERLEIGYVGRLVSEKGVQLLLRAARRLKDESLTFHLTFIGDGPERKNLETMAKQLNVEDCITITGYLRGRDLDDAVRDVTVLAMPSICEETAGLAAIEHMMRGGVVIAADIGGLSEVVGDAGLKFPPGDWEALAACIKHIMEKPAEIAILGGAARQRAAHFFLRDRMVREYANLFMEVRGRHSARGEGSKGVPDRSREDSKDSYVQ